MNWHSRYLQQAKWTRDLRAYLFNQAKLNDASRVLEVGCGTGAILSELPNHLALHGLDLDPAALAECRVNAPIAALIHGNALALPCSDQSFDIVYCHFLLLWVKNPLQALLEMKRITKTGGHIIAFAEPDYSKRIDQPDELIPLGKWQTEALIKQGANPALGAALAELFFQAGIPILETGTIQSVDNEPSAEEWEMEWAVMESDLAESVSGADIQKMKRLDQQARVRGERKLNVPTYFCLGHVKM
jgi:ubiquinone/menaquinone biosynthesis C-methylase UbiE